MTHGPYRWWMFVFVFVLLIPGAVSGQEIDVHEVVQRCEQAIGGSAGVAGLHSLSFVTRGEDRARDLMWEIRRPNLIRKERPGRLVLVFDGARAGFLEGPVLEDGTLDTPHLVPQEDWHHFEMDIALFVPAFFDHPAVHTGVEEVAGSSAHVLEVKLPMGGTAVYWVDAERFIPVKVGLPGWDLERVFADWQETGGYLLPRAYWDVSNPDDITRMEDMVVNGSLAVDRFTLPATVAAR